MKKPKTNFFFKSIECWNCFEYKHKMVITKYHGILCKSCYNDVYEKYKSHLSYFISALEIEFSTNLKKEFETLESITETIRDYYYFYCIEMGHKLSDFEECYKEDIEFAEFVYKTLEMGNNFQIQT